jgi:WD40 repeat protein/serine/threonine protein kinase
MRSGFSPPTNGTDHATSHQSELARVLDAYLAAIESGQAIDPETLIANHPQIADRLRACLAVLRVASEVEARADADAAIEPALNTRLGDFRILRIIGRGGMGLVFEAEQLSLHRRVALKMLPFAAALDPQQLRRFQIEAQAAAQLHNTNIVPIFLVGCEQGVHYYAMQYIEGQTLANVIADLKRLTNAEEVSAHLSLPLERGEAGEGSSDLQQQTPIPPNIHTPAYFQTIARLGQQAAEGLEHAHQLGIIHRDIKPSNLLIDIRGNLWITDFGLARIQSDSTLTMSGDIIGTLRYMSPEQSSGGETQIDHRADIYSLGATLYELLTLHPVHQSQDRAELIRRMTVEDPVAPRRHNPWIPKDLKTIVIKALSKDADHRYQSAQSLAEDLRRFQDHRPIQARRPSPWKRAEKWIRRHKAITVSAIAVSVLMAISAMMITVQINEKRKHIQQNQQLIQVARHEQYVKDMRQALGLIQQTNDVTMVRNVLTRHIPTQGEADNRSFPWYHLWRVCHMKPTAWEGHNGEVYHVEFSPSGQMLASCGQDGTARLWDVSTGKTLHILRAHNGDVNWVTFAPNSQLVATGGDDGTIRLWRTTDGQPIKTLGKHAVLVTGVLFTPDSQRLISTDRSGNVRIWNLTLGQEEEPIPLRPGDIEGMALSPDGKMLATCGTENAARLWDLNHRREIDTFRTAANGQCVAFSHNGRTLATAGDDCVVRLWDLSTLTLQTTLEAARAGLQYVSFSPDDSAITCGGKDTLIYLCDIRSGKLRKSYRGQEAESRRWCVVFTPDGQSIVSSSGQGEIEHWDTNTIQEQETLCFPLESKPLCISVHGSGIHVVARDAVKRNSFFVGSIDLNRRVYQRGSNHLLAADVMAGAISPDANAVAIADQSRQLSVWKKVAGTSANRFEKHLITESIGARDSRWEPNEAMRFSPDGNRLVFGVQHAGLTLLNLTNNSRWSLPISPDLAMSTLYSASSLDLFVNDGRNLVSWNLKSQPVCARAGTIGQWEGITAISQDGQKLAIAAGGRIELWNSESLKREVSLYRHSSPVACAVFSPDAKILASGDFKGNVKLWDLETCQEIVSLHPHSGKVNALWFSESGAALHSYSVYEATKGEHFLEIVSWPATPNTLSTTP